MVKKNNLVDSNKWTCLIQKHFETDVLCVGVCLLVNDKFILTANTALMINANVIKQFI